LKDSDFEIINISPIVIDSSTTYKSITNSLVTVLYWWKSKDDRPYYKKELPILPILPIEDSSNIKNDNKENNTIILKKDIHTHKHEHKCLELELDKQWKEVSRREFRKKLLYAIYYPIQLTVKTIVVGPIYGAACGAYYFAGYGTDIAVKRNELLLPLDSKETRQLFVIYPLFGAAAGLVVGTAEGLIYGLRDWDIKDMKFSFLRPISSFK